MGIRERERAWIRRREMIQRLGGVCVQCGTKGTEDPKQNPLEIDHIYGRDYEIRNMGPSWRVSVYVREEKKGLLQVLCKRCNGAKGDPRLKNVDRGLTAEEMAKETEREADLTPEERAAEWDDLPNPVDPIVECPNCTGDGHWAGTIGEIRRYFCTHCDGWFTDNIKTGNKTMDKGNDLSITREPRNPR